MSSNMNMTYECFIRGAFSINKDNLIDRWGDPAGIANTDEFDAGNINTIKAGISYSMEIYRHEIYEKNQISDNEYDGMDRIINDVLSATDKITIFNLIEDFNKKYVHKYVKYKWNK